MRIPRPALKTSALPTLALLTLGALSTLSTLAAAQDEPPARVGRVAFVQGQVSIGDENGGGLVPVQRNYPVTSGTLLATAPGARAELRIGSTSIRLDGDSSLDLTQLDDGNLRLRLDYGSVSVHVPDPDAAGGFELTTPQASVRLQQPGSVRIDVERATSAIEVFEGAALVDGGGAELTLRAGKRAELGDDDEVRTLPARRDAFDDWASARDRVDDNAAATRYVDAGMTGYEDLDRYGSWQVDNDYGPLWTPVVATDWVPYRDGSWVWIDPWGWTWVDNAPWGYAPFHYGRWVYVHSHWAWAPGRRHDHPVWAPALVGWVGGEGWNVTFADRGTRPASGWYPLTPHDRFVPSYHLSDARLRQVNENVRPEPQRARDFRPQGLTVVPQDRFAQPGRVNVARTPLMTAAPTRMRNAPAAAPALALAGAQAAPPPPPDRLPQADRFAQGRARDQDYRRGAGGHGPIVLTAPSVTGQPAQGLGVTSPPPHLPSQGLGVTSPTPHLPAQGLGVTSPAPHLPSQALGIHSPPPVPGGPELQSPIRQSPLPQGGWQRDERREQVEAQPDGVQYGARERQAQPQTAPQAGFNDRIEPVRRGDMERPRPMAASPTPAAPAAPAARGAPAQREHAEAKPAADSHAAHQER